MTTHRTIARMLRGNDAASWLVAADMIEEQGMAPYDDQSIRRRALLALAVRDAMLAADARRKGRSRYPQEAYRIGAENLFLIVSGAARRLLLHVAAGLGDRKSFYCDVRRDLLARDDYADRRAAELADSVIACAAKKGAA